MNNLIEAIKQYQANENLSDTQLGKLLGIDRSTWAYIKSGRRNPGVKFLRAVAHEIPQLASVIHVEIFDSDLSTTPSQTAQDSKLGRFKAWLMSLLDRLPGPDTK